MRILLYSINFEPEVVGIGKFNGDLARWLVERGHEVTVVTAYPYYPQWRVSDEYRKWWYQTEHMSGIKVRRAPLWVPRRPSALARIVHLVSFALSSAPVVLWEALRYRPDVVLALEPPLTCAPAARVVASLARAKAWLHVQDLEVDAAFEMGLLRGRAVRWIALRLERMLLRSFDGVSAISDHMQRRLVAKGVPANRCALFPNWVDTSSIHPLPRPSPLRAVMSVPADTSVVLYAGSMGHKQGLDVLVQAARQLSQRAILFVLVGSGPARDGLVEAASELANVVFIPLQPPRALNDLLNLADIHVLTQLDDAADVVMPSKLSGMMASGRPVIATVRPGTQVADAIEGCGMAVPPGDATALAAGILWLHEHGAERHALGAAARARAEALWQRDNTLLSFEALLQSRVLST